MPLHKICARVSQRWVIVFACFLGLFNVNVVQVCLSVAIIQMVVPNNYTDEFSKNNTYTSVVTDVSSFHNKSMTIKSMRFNWDEKTQSYIMNSYYWGSIFALILGGAIVNKLGAKRTIATSALFISFSTLLVPMSLQWYGAISFFAVRFLTGIGAGMIHPAVMKLFSQWIPEDKRSFAASWAYAGTSLGFIVGMAASGAIIERFDIGWPVIFYIYGTFGFFVFCVQCAICYDSPSQHPCISKSEINLLKRKLKNSNTYLPSTPWNLIIRSKSIWALLIAHTGIVWCQMIVVNYTPMFMNSILKFNLETNGYVSSSPHVGSLIWNWSFSWIVDRLIAKKIISTAYARKIANTICSVATGLVLITVTYVGHKPTFVVGLYVLATVLLSTHHISTMVNALDLTPNYAGPIQGVVMAVGSSIGSMSTYFAALMMPTQAINEWRSVFFMVLSVGAITNLFFVIFGKAEVQEWNDPKIVKLEKTEVNNGVIDNSEHFAML